VLTGGALAAVAAPFAAFAAALAALGGALVAAAVCVARVPLGEAVASVSTLGVFVWSAAQSAAAAFRLTQGLAPPAVAPLYSALAALQFAGVAAAPECLNAPPYLAQFAAAAATAGIVGGGGLALALVVSARARAAAAPRSWPEFSLNAAAFALAVGFGALVAAVAAVLPCTDAAPTPVRAYLALVNDGASLVAALGDAGSPLAAALATAAKPSALADFARAAADPPFAAARGLRAALDARIPVRLVAADAYSVCYEGAHRAAWNAAAAVAAALALVLLAGGAAAAATAARARRWTRVVDADGDVFFLSADGESAWEVPPGGVEAGGGAAPAPPRACARASAALTTALTPADVRRGAEWFVPAQLALTAASSALSGLARAQADAARFAALLGAAIAAQAAFAALTLRVAPFAAAARWKNGATAALLLLPVVSAGVALELAATLRAGHAPAAGLALAPLILAAPVPPAILYFWWRAVVLRALREAATRAAAAAAVHETGGDFATANPLKAAAATPPGTPPSPTLPPPPPPRAARLLMGAPRANVPAFVSAHAAPGEPPRRNAALAAADAAASADEAAAAARTAYEARLAAATARGDAAAAMDVVWGDA